MGEHSAKAKSLVVSSAPPTSLGARATSGMGWALGQRWSSQILASAVFVVLAREIAPKAFGLVALAGVFVAFANVFLGNAFTQALIAQHPLRKEHLDTAFWINTGLAALLAAIGVGFAPLIANIQGNGDVRPVLQALCLDFLLGSLGAIPNSMMARDLRFKQLSIRTLVSNVVADAIGVTLAVQGAGVWALVAQTLSQTAIDSFILYLVTPQRPGLSVTRQGYLDLRNFGFNATGLNFFSLANRQSDNLLIGIYLGPVQLGYYSVAYQVLNLFEDAFVNTTQVVMFPVFASVAQDRGRLLRAYEMASRVTAIVAIPAFVGLSLVSGQMIPLVFGHKWESTVPVAEVLAFIGIVHAITQFNGQVCKAVGKAGVVLRFSMLNTVVNVAGFFAAVHFGIFWVAVAYVVRGWVLYPLSVTMVRKAIQHDIRHHLRGFVAPALATAAMAAAVGLFEVTTQSFPAWPRLVLTVLVGAVVYPAVLWPLAGREVTAIVRSLQQARRGGPKRGAGQRRNPVAVVDASANGTEPYVPPLEPSLDQPLEPAETWNWPDGPEPVSSPVPGLTASTDQVELSEELRALATGSHRRPTPARRPTPHRGKREPSPEHRILTTTRPEQKVGKDT